MLVFHDHYKKEKKDTVTIVNNQEGFFFSLKISILKHNTEYVYIPNKEIRLFLLPLV